MMIIIIFFKMLFLHFCIDGNAAPDYEETVVWDEKDNAYSDDGNNFYLIIYFKNLKTNLKYF